MCGFIGEFGNSQSPKSEFYSLFKLSKSEDLIWLDIIITLI